MTAPYRVRHARPADYEAIQPVLDDWWGRPIASVLQPLFLDHFFDTSYVAEQDGKLVGFLIGFMSPARRDVAYVHFVGVHPDLRRHGLARDLYGRFFELARADGRAEVWAVTGPINETSVKFHESMGFTVRGPIRGYLQFRKSLLHDA